MHKISEVQRTKKMALNRRSLPPRSLRTQVCQMKTGHDLLRVLGKQDLHLSVDFESDVGQTGGVERAKRRGEERHRMALFQDACFLSPNRKPN